MEIDLTAEDSAKNLHNINMFNPRKRLTDRVPTTHLNLSEGETEEDNDDQQLVIDENQKQTFTFKGVFSTGRPTARKHPPPINKKARNQLKRLHQLGYSSFEKTGI